MSFNPANVTKIAALQLEDGTLLRRFTYSTSDNLSDVDDANYFDAAKTTGLLRGGDLLAITANNGKSLGIFLSDGTGGAIQGLASDLNLFWEIA